MLGGKSTRVRSKASRRFGNSMKESARTEAKGLLLVLCLLICFSFVCSEETRGLQARHSRIHSISEDGKEEKKERDLYRFTINPLQGNSGGGTQVTLILHKDFPDNPNGDFWCKFGEKVVPAQSYFSCEEGKCVVCQAPAAPTRQYNVKISTDGKKYHSGPKFLYYS